MATVNLGAIKFNWKGAYNNATAYVADDVVSSGGNSYVCILASTGNAVSNGTYWSLMAQAGTNGTDGTDVGLGTAGQVLKTNSGATATEWGNEAGGAWNVISSTNITSQVATVLITGITATYDSCFLKWSNVEGSSGNIELRLQVGDSNGIDSGGSDYEGNYIGNISSGSSWGTMRSGGTVDGNYMSIDPYPYDGIGNSTGSGSSGHCYIDHPQSTTVYPLFYGQSLHTSSNIDTNGVNFWYVRKATLTMDRIQLSLSSGVFATGRFTLYGLKHS